MMGKKIHRSFIERDTKLKDRLTDLRRLVETINQLPAMALRGGIFKKLSKVDIFTAHIDGVLIGYKLDDLGVFMRRRIYLSFPGYKLSEIPENQKDPIMAVIFDVFLDYGQQIPEIEIQREGEVVMIEQHFLALLLKKDPNIRKGEGNVDDGSGLQNLN